MATCPASHGDSEVVARGTPTEVYPQERYDTGSVRRFVLADDGVHQPQRKGHGGINGDLRHGLLAQIADVRTGRGVVPGVSLGPAERFSTSPRKAPSRTQRW